MFSFGTLPIARAFSKAVVSVVIAVAAVAAAAGTTLPGVAAPVVAVLVGCGETNILYTEVMRRKHLQRTTQKGERNKKPKKTMLT